MENEYLTKTGPLIIRQDNRLMTATKHSLLQIVKEIYTNIDIIVARGKTKVFAEAITKAMSVGNDIKNVCIWITDTGQLMRFHTWAYKDLNHRAGPGCCCCRSGLERILERWTGQTDEMHASILPLGPLSVEVGTLTLIQLVNMLGFEIGA